MNSIKPASGRIGGCLETRYIGTIFPNGNTGTSIASLRRYSTSPTLSASPASITVPSGDDWGIIWYIERARAINGASLLMWYAPNNADSVEATLLQASDGLQMVFDPIFHLGELTPHPRLQCQLDETTEEDLQGGSRVVLQVEPLLVPPFVGRHQQE
jgi:hypothetical protein